MAKVVNFSFILSLLILFSCASNKELIVQSKLTKVKVSIKDAKSTNFQDIGHTPVNVNSSKLKLLESSEYVTIRLSKEGHISENYLINLKGRNKFRIVGQLNRVADWTVPASEYSSYVANDIISKTQLVNSYVKKGKFNNALQKVDKLLESFPRAAILYDLKGSILLLKGDKGRSIASFQKSLNLNPDNDKTKKVLTKLKGK